LGYFPKCIGKVNRNMSRLVPENFKSVRRIGQSGPDNSVYNMLTIATTGVAHWEWVSISETIFLKLYKSRMIITRWWSVEIRKFKEVIRIVICNPIIKYVIIVSRRSQVPTTYAIWAEGDNFFSRIYPPHRNLL